MKRNEVRERIFAEEIIKGKTQTEAAMIASPHLSEISASKTGNRLAHRKTVQDILLRALKKHDITIAKAVKPIADALTAEKVHIVGNGDQAMAEVVPDHSVRLKASSMALDLLGAKKGKDSPQTPLAPLNSQELTSAIQNNDLVAVQNLLFKKKQEE